MEPLFNSHPGELSILATEGNGCPAEVLSHEQFLDCWRTNFAIHRGMMLAFNWQTYDRSFCRTVQLTMLFLFNSFSSPPLDALKSCKSSSPASLIAFCWSKGPDTQIRRAFASNIHFKTCSVT